MNPSRSEAEAALDRIRQYLRNNILLLTEDLRTLRSIADSDEVLAIIGRFEEVVDQVKITAEMAMDDAHAVALTASALESVNLATQLIATVSRMHRAANRGPSPSLTVAE